MRVQRIKCFSKVLKMRLFLSEYFLTHGPLDRICAAERVTKRYTPSFFENCLTNLLCS